jgi:hypothetical protein
MQVALTAILWGCGTAVGEVPPYFLSYKAASAGRRNEAYHEIQQAVQQSASGMCSGVWMWVAAPAAAASCWVLLALKTALDCGGSSSHSFAK